MKKTNAPLVLSVLGILLIIGCTFSNEKDAAKYSDALIVVANAKKVHYTSSRGSDQVIYVVKEHYPAPIVLIELSQRLAAKGWTPLSEDYLNPGEPSSHVSGWSNFIDAQKKQQKRVLQWLAQWENNNHDILWCTLRYTFPENGPDDLDTLTVSMAFIPAKIAAATKKKTSEYLKQYQD